MKKIDLYEKRYMEITNILNNLESAINEFNKVKDYIKEIDDYYTSDEFLIDYDNKEINNKYAILSEDGVWNMFEKIDDLSEYFNEIVNDLNAE